MPSERAEGRLFGLTTRRIASYDRLLTRFQLAQTLAQPPVLILNRL